MVSERTRDSRKERFWRRMLKGQAGSGLLVRAWCDQHGQRTSAFYWWRAELPRWDAQQPSSSGHGRRRLPANLERRKVIHDLPEDQKPCPCCGKLRHVIGRETSEQLDFVPAKLRVIEHVRLTYACPTCEQQAAKAVRRSPRPRSRWPPLEKGLAAPGPLAYVFVSEYSEHMPLYRLQERYRRQRMEFSRSTLCEWVNA